MKPDPLAQRTWLRLVGHYVPLRNPSHFAYVRSPPTKPVCRHSVSYRHCECNLWTNYNTNNEFKFVFIFGVSYNQFLSG